MGLKIETWSIAFRKKREGLIFEDKGGFKVIKNGHKGWYADPFLFEYKDETFLFAEFFSYELRKGVIVYSKYNEANDEFEEFKEIIHEDYHLSYPLIFTMENDIYLIPEANDSKTLYAYKAVDFPEKWEKQKPYINDIRLVDTTPFIYNDTLYAFSLKLSDSGNELLLLEFDKDKCSISQQKVLTKDMKIARPGGNIFDFNGRKVMVSQDCENEYGRALNFLEIKDNFLNEFNDSVFHEVNPDCLRIINDKCPSGIHTYNFNKKIEVIDVKYYRRSYYRIYKTIISKLFKNKGK